MCSFMGKGLAVFQKSFLSIHVFWLKMQKYAFWKKNVLEWSFILNLSAVGDV